MSNLFKDDYKVKIANDGETALKIAASGLPTGSDPARHHDARNGRYECASDSSAIPKQ